MKVEEGKGRLETARAKVMEAEEEMAKVDEELQGIQQQIYEREGRTEGAATEGGAAWR